MQDHTLPVDHVTRQCSYAHLMATLEWDRTGVWELPTERCTRQATHYMCVSHAIGGGIQGEMYNNICAVHEPQVRKLDGWRWSRPKQYADALSSVALSDEADRLRAENANLREQLDRCNTARQKLQDELDGGAS